MEDCSFLEPLSVRIKEEIFLHNHDRKEEKKFRPKEYQLIKWYIIVDGKISGVPFFAIVKEDCSFGLPAEDWFLAEKNGKVELLF